MNHKQSLPAVSNSSKQLSLIPQDTPSESPFEKIKHVDEHGEFWYARELMPLLEYSKWQNFQEPINKAKTAMEGNYWVTAISKPIISGKGRQQNVEDFRLTQDACYFIAMNGDVTKQAIKDAQAYFVTQTRKQEIEEKRRAKHVIDNRNRDKTAYQLKGKSEAWAEHRIESKADQKNLNAVLYATHEEHKPDYASIAGVQNKGLFDMTKSEIVAYLGLLPKDEDKYRDHLGEYALQAYKQVFRTTELHIKKSKRPLTTKEQIDIVAQVVRIVAPTMKALSEFAGQDFVSGAPLNEHGQAMLERNVKLLKDGR